MSESLTIGIILTLVFGAMFYYIYSRVGQSEKRVSLLENILLDLKVAMESSLIRRDDFGVEETRVPPTFYANSEEFAQDEANVADAPSASPASPASSPASTPFLEQVSQAESLPVTQDEDQYDKMTNKELKDAAKGRKIKGYTAMTRSELQEALRGGDNDMNGVDMSEGTLTLDAQRAPFYVRTTVDMCITGLEKYHM